MNDIAKGGVSTGRDACTLLLVFVCICIVACRDSPISEHFNNINIIIARIITEDGRTGWKLSGFLIRQVGTRLKAVPKLG